MLFGVIPRDTQQDDETFSDLADNLAINRYAGARDALDDGSHLFLWRSAGSDFNTAGQGSLVMMQKIDNHPSDVFGL